ncbi:ferritin heavy chain B [Scaptodrosophila lebanonensis]|uniref:Ferritin n=1 Tax=Drosophila lebanonensis TaxID=7225 RepID=A0A6J2TZI9_DROLE|nr:ferritin heavy chain B [Scaptodrosophila lebanonensis]
MAYCFFIRARHMCMIMRQNFAKSCEAKLNDQINMELKACHQYLAMAYHFDRADVSSPGIFNFFVKASMEEREHAELIMKYMNKRGGLIRLSSVPEPVPCYKDVLHALKHALQLELEVNQHLLDVHALAGKENDPNLCDFIEANFLQEQVDGQKILADYIRQLERAHIDLGEYLFDKYMGSGMHGASNEKNGH